MQINIDMNHVANEITDHLLQKFNMKSDLFSEDEKSELINGVIEALTKDSDRFEETVEELVIKQIIDRTDTNLNVISQFFGGMNND